MNNDDTIRHVYTRHYDRAVALLPTKQQADALRLICDSSKPTPATDVAATLNITIQHANVLLRGLRLNGYIKRVAYPRPTGGVEYHYEVMPACL